MSPTDRSAVESIRINLGSTVSVGLSATRQAGGQMESREECLREATECDRLAQLADTLHWRRILLAQAVHITPTSAVHYVLQ
jgi:hypothetical protein